MAFLRRTASHIKNWLLWRLPDDLRMRIQWRTQKKGTVIEPEIFELCRWADASAIAVDAGANHGVVAATMASWFKKIEAFEPNYPITECARKFGPSNIRFHSTALSSTIGEAKLTVPETSYGLPLYGWATLEEHGAEVTGLSSKIAVRLTPLDDLQLDRVAVIKIDVEGHERQVLEGSVQTLQRCRPVILCETRQAQRSWLYKFAADRAYKIFVLVNGRLVLEDVASPSSECYNQFLVPEEKLPSLTESGE